MSVVYRLRSIALTVAAVTVVAAIAAGCSSGEGVATVEPLVAESPELAALPDPVVVATVEPEPEKKPAPLVVATETAEASEPIAATTAPEPEPVATESPAPPAELEPTYRGDRFFHQQTPLAEFVDFPADVAIVYRDGAFCYEGCSWELPLYRIYEREGELVKETLFTAAHPMIQAIEPYGDNAAAVYEQVEVISTADGSRMVAVLCHRSTCSSSGMGGWGYDHTELPLPTTDLYESIDGGVTWQHLDTLERPWIPEAITDGGDGREPLLLLYSLSLVVPPWEAYMLWSNGEVEVEELQVLFQEEPTASELVKRMEAEGPQESPYDYFTGGLPDREPDDIGGPKVRLHAVQFGPFLRVADDVDGCLPVVADPSPDAEELDCMAARVLLQDQGETATDNGTTWHKVKTPAGVTGWADGRHLE